MIYDGCFQRFLSYMFLLFWPTTVANFILMILLVTSVHHVTICSGASSKMLSLPHPTRRHNEAWRAASFVSFCTSCTELDLTPFSRFLISLSWLPCCLVPLDCGFSHYCCSTGVGVCGGSEVVPYFDLIPRTGSFVSIPECGHPFHLHLIYGHDATMIRFTQLFSKFPPTVLLNFACDD